MIIRGWHTGAPEESKKKFLFESCEIGSEGLSGFEGKWLFAEAVELPGEPFFDLGRRFPGDIAGFELLPRVAEL